MYDNISIKEKLSRTKTALENVNTRYKLLFERSLSAIAVTDLNFQFTEVNPAFCNLLGYSESELLKMSMPQVSLKTDRNKSVSLIKKLINDEIDHFTIEKKYVHKNGSIVRANTAVKSTLDENGNCNGCIASIQEITIEKFQKLKSSNDDLQSYAHNVSHDLKAPLDNIIGMIRILEMKNSLVASDEDWKILKSISYSAKKMSLLISEILNNSLIEGNSKGNIAKIDLNQIIEDVLSNLRVSIEESNANITYNNLGTITGHYSEFIQLFQNIISNSIKYAKPDVPPIITINVLKKGSDFEYTIEDNGLGISKKEVNRVFEEFNRGDFTDHNGYGIGLSTCEKIVNKYHGKIKIESEPKIGTNITFTLKNLYDDD